MMTGLEVLADEMDVRRQAALVHLRKFGPEYAKADPARACRNGDTIICMLSRCQDRNACQFRKVKA